MKRFLMTCLSVFLLLVGFVFSDKTVEGDVIYDNWGQLESGTTVSYDEDCLAILTENNSIPEGVTVIMNAPCQISFFGPNARIDGKLILNEFSWIISEEESGILTIGETGSVEFGEDCGLGGHIVIDGGTVKGERLALGIRNQDYSTVSCSNGAIIDTTDTSIVNPVSLDGDLTITSNYIAYDTSDDMDDVLTIRPTANITWIPKGDTRRIGNIMCNMILDGVIHLPTDTYINIGDSSHRITLSGNGRFTGIYNGWIEGTVRVTNNNVQTDPKFEIENNEPAHIHTLETTTTRATLSKNGKKETKCTVCGQVTQTTVIYAPKTIKLSAATYTYDGKIKKPAVTVTNSKAKVIPASNYTVTYSSGRKNVGSYKVKVTFKGDYIGTKSLTFKINPPKTLISTLTSKSKAFSVKWTRKTQVTGYQIQYSTSSKFAEGTKTVKVTSANTYTKTIRNLQAKKKYYVRIRTYKTVNGTQYYSAWSAVKAVTTK